MIITALVKHEKQYCLFFSLKIIFEDNITNMQDLNIYKTQNYSLKMVGMDASSTNMHALVAAYTSAYTVLHVFLS